jgi:plasmid stability protein
MPNLTLRGIPKGVYSILKRDAKQHGRSLNAEILDALGDKTTLALRRMRMKREIKDFKKVREEISRKYPSLLDSTDLIREDRDSR